MKKCVNLLLPRICNEMQGQQNIKSGNVHRKLQFMLPTFVSQSHSHWPLCSVIVNISCLLYSLLAQNRSGRLLPMFVPCFTNIAFYLIISLPNYIPIRGHPLQLSVTYQRLIFDEFARDPSSFIFLLISLIMITRSLEMPHTTFFYRRTMHLDNVKVPFYQQMHLLLII